MGKGKYLGEFELLVLLAVVRLRADAYGVTIRHIPYETTNQIVRSKRTVRIFSFQ